MCIETFADNRTVGSAVMTVRRAPSSSSDEMTVIRSVYIFISRAQSKWPQLFHYTWMAGA